MASPSSSSSKLKEADRAIRFVYCDESGKLKINPDAIDVLTQIHGPIGVVSVSGPSRQGKSFLLNQLLGGSTGFRVASTHRAGTKGLWMWNAPLRKTAIDGTEYNLLLLESEGSDAHDRTETYSTQLFSLVFLLSSLFVYNQLGAIDEAALNRLSFVTEMTKHICVRASGEKDTVYELGQFSPVFVWLLRDFCLELTEKNMEIMHRDYLELALRPTMVRGKDEAAKNMIRESIRALFPDRECFTLVRPLNDDLQHLDHFPPDNFQPEFQSGLESLSKFVYERTRPKHVRGSVMTGPILVGITKYFLDTLNNGAVPTISSLWQNVEESECQRAFDTATEVYMSAFDNTKPPEEVSLREAHEKAVQKSILAYNASAVGAGSTRQKYEELLEAFFEKTFEGYKKNAYMEAELQCSNAIHDMEKKLQAACQVADVNFHQIVMVLDSLLSEYEASVNGPTKWQKLVTFLRQSLQGPIMLNAKRLIDEVSYEKSSLMLKSRSIEHQLELLNKQLEASEKFKTEYQKLCGDAIHDLKKLSDHYNSRIVDLDSKCSLLEERCSSLLEMLDSSKQESLDWKRKYDEMLTKKRKFDDEANVKTKVFKSQNCEAESRVAACHEIENVQLARKEAYEWKEKYDNAVKETMAALEKAASVEQCSTEHAKLREEAQSAEFSKILAEKDEEIRDKVRKLEDAEQKLLIFISQLKAAETKLENHDLELSALTRQIRELTDMYEFVRNSAQSLETEAQMLAADKTQLEQRYLAKVREFEEVREKCKIAQEEVKLAYGFVETGQSQLVTAQNELLNFQQLDVERLSQIENACKQIEILESQKLELSGEVERSRVSEGRAISKVSLLEAVVKEREKQIEALKLQWEQRESLFQAFEGGLESELVEANGTVRAEFLEPDPLQGERNLHQGDLNSVHSNKSATYAAHRAFSHGKRARPEVSSASLDSVQDMDIDREVPIEMKKPKTTMTLQKCVTTEADYSVLKGNETGSVGSNAGSVDYTKFTVKKLRQELTENGFGAELLELRSPKKNDILHLYKKLVLKK